MYHAIPSTICLTHSLGAGKICVVCHSFANRYTCTYCTRWDSPRSLQYVSCAWARTKFVIRAQLVLRDRAMVFCILKPNTFISALYDISSTLTVVSHVPTDNACDCCSKLRRSPSRRIVWRLWLLWYPPVTSPGF
jgi:hypothetical protein